MQEAALVGACCLSYQWDNEIWCVFSVGMQASIIGYLLETAKWNEKRKVLLFPLQDTSKFSSHSTWVTTEMAEHTHWLFLAKVSCVFMEQGICLQPSGASVFNEILILCSSKYVSHVAESCFSSPCLQRPTWAVTEQKRTHEHTQLLSILFCARLFIVYTFTLLHRKQLQIMKRKWNAMSLLINVILDTDRSRRRYDWWSGAKCGSAGAELESVDS